MRVLITGAAGFIGSQLAYRLWKQGADLVLVDDFSYGSKDNLTFEDHDFNGDIIVADISKFENVRDIFEAYKDIDYVYNIAGIAPLPDCQTNPSRAIEVNVNGLVNVLECARIYGIKKVIQASTNAMYENETAFPVSEEFYNLPTLIYPNTKYCAERFAQSYADTYGMNVTCIRFANVYGPHIDCLRKQPPFVGYMIRELYYDRTPIFHSTGEQKRDYIYVDDLIDLAIAAQEGTGFDTVNCSSNQSYSVNYLYQVAQELMGKNIPAEYADCNHYWEKYPALYNGAYAIKQSILEHEVNKYSLCENKHAKEKYNWEPKVDIKTGLKAVIDYEIKLLSKV